MNYSKLQRLGVRIHHYDNLHAKVYVIGSKLFVGSANVSIPAKNTLIETCISTTDRKLLSKAVNLFKDLLESS